MNGQELLNHLIDMQNSGIDLSITPVKMADKPSSAVLVPLDEVIFCNYLDGTNAIIFDPRPN